MSHRHHRPAPQHTTFVDLVMSTVGMFLWIVLVVAAFVIFGREQAQAAPFAATIFSQRAIDAGAVEFTILAALATGLLLGAGAAWAFCGPRRISIDDDPYGQAFGDVTLPQARTQFDALFDAPAGDDIQRRIDALRARETSLGLGGRMVQS